MTTSHHDAVTEGSHARTASGLRTSFILDSAFAGSLGMVANLCNYLFVMWAGRSLLPLQFGLFVACGSIFTLLAVFANALQMRVNQILTGRSITACWVYIRHLLIQHALILLAATVGCALFGWWILEALHASTADLAACLVVIGSILGYSVFMGFLGAQHRVRLQALSGALGAGTKFLVAVGLGYWTHAVAPWLLAYTIHYGAVILVGGSVLWFGLANRHGGEDSGHAPAPEPLFKNVTPYLLGVLPLVADQVYVRIWAPEISGAYGGLTTLAKISFYACGPIFIAILPYLLRETHHGRSTKTLACIAALIIGTVAGGAAVVQALFSHEIVSLCFGHKYIEISGFLPLLGWASALYAGNYGVLLLLFVRKDTRLYALLMIPVVVQALLFAGAGASLADCTVAQCLTIACQSAVIALYFGAGAVLRGLRKL